MPLQCIAHPEEVDTVKDPAKDMSPFLEALCASTEQYRAKMEGGIYERYEDVPPVCRSLFLERDSDGTRNYDYAGLLQRGKDWIIEPLRTLQPYSFQALHEVVGPLLIGIVLIPDPFKPDDLSAAATPVMFFDASGRMVEVRPSFPGDTYEDGNDCFGYLLSLPDALAKSWLWRTGSWRIPSEPFQGPLVNRRLIGHPSGGDWKDADTYLDSMGRGWKKKYLSRIVEKLPDTVTNKNGIRRYRFQCFLDTRPAGLGGPMGDQFFVCSTRRDQVVYHIHQGDIDNIRILRDPADAIDRYCAHVLRRIPGEFDFSSWSDPLLA